MHPVFRAIHSSVGGSARSAGRWHWLSDSNGGAPRGGVRRVDYIHDVAQILFGTDEFDRFGRKFDSVSEVFSELFEERKGGIGMHRRSAAERFEGESGLGGADILAKARFEMRVGAQGIVFISDEVRDLRRFDLWITNHDSICR